MRHLRVYTHANHRSREDKSALSFFLSKPHGVTGDGQKCCMLFCSSLSRFALCIPYKSHLTLKHGVAFIVKQALHLVCDSLSSVQNEMMTIPGLFSGHPSIHPLFVAYPIQDPRGAGVYPSCHWSRVGGSPWSGRQSITGPTWRQIITHSHIHAKY